MPHVIPEKDSVPADFAQFTYDTWRDLDNTYAFWIERWKRTLEYVRSQHWNALKHIEPDSLPTWKRYPVINYTLAIYADYLSDFLKSEIRYSALPASPDPSDIDSAELVEQLNTFLWEKLSLQEKRIQLASWLLTCGTAYLRVFWNTETGKMIPLAIPGPNGQLIAIDPETAQPAPGQEPMMVDQGEIGVEVISPQYVRYAPAPAHGVMIGLLLTREEATSMYGEEKASELAYTSTYEDFDANLHTIETPTITPAKDERALTIQHYIPRSSTHPDGLWWTSASNDKMLAGPHPLPGGEIPIVSFVWIPVPGNPHIGISPLYDVTFSNKLYDEIVARVLEWHNKVKPKVLLKAGGGLTYGDLNEEPFQELAVNPGGEPEFMEVRQAPDTFFKTMQDAQNDMMAVGGYMLSSKGQAAPGNAESRNSWRMPTEPVEQGPTAVAIMNSKAGWEHLGKLLPAYAATFYTEPRVIAIQGSDKSYQWREFIGSADLKNMSATIRVDEVSLYPWSRAALRDSVQGVLDSQFGQLLFMNPDGSPNMDRVNAAMNATGIDVSIPSLDPDVMEAKNENMFFKEGMGQPQPQFWQNHQVHLDEHERILKSMEFNSWPDDAKKAFMAHVQQTSEMLNEAAQQEQQAMVDMEKALRDVRETAELQADIKRMISEMALEAFAEAVKAEIPTSGDDSKKESSGS